LKPLRELTYAEALNEALKEEMRRDSKVIVMGEDVGIFGGVYKVTKGLLEEFGPDRVYDTPISEDGFVGAAVGAAVAGLKPVVEVMYPDFLPCCMNQIVNHAAKLHYMTGGQLSVPLVIRTAFIQGRGSGADHSQVLIPLFMHIPGLYVATPSTPFDSKGLLKTAIRNGSPTMFFEAASLYNLKGPVPEEDYTIPFGKADVKKVGEDVTIVAVSATVHTALSAADVLEKSEVDVEVIDPRTLVPLDKEAIINSVKKTGRLIVVENSWRTCGVGAEISAMIMEEAFDLLDAPVLRIATRGIPEPVSPALLKLFLLNEEKIYDTVKKLGFEVKG